MDSTTRLLQRAVEIDEERVLQLVLGNLVALEAGASETPVEALIDASAEVYRTEPGAGGAMNVEDYRAVLGQTVQFLDNEHNGLERLYRIVQNRELER